MARVNEEMASRTDGTYADGTPRPTGYAMGVQVARRDAATYGPHNVRCMPTPGTEYAAGYADALADARDEAHELMHAASRRSGRRHPCKGDLGSVPCG